MGDKILSVYWFTILFIVAGAVVYMVALFYSSPYDVREVEANILTNQIADCISQRGYFKEEIIVGLNNDNFLERCNLNFGVEESFGWQEQGQYYVEIDFFGISQGNVNLKLECNQGKYSPFCLERNLQVLDKEKNLKIIKILTVVRKTEKNVK